MVSLSEPLESTLEWDYNKNDDTELIFRWNITLKNGDSGLLAFSNHDLDTKNLDVIIFGKNDRLYNGYTDDRSFLFIPRNRVELKYSIERKERFENGKKHKITIQFNRPLDTCDEKQRNYIIDRGTTHLLTGSISRKDFQKIYLRHHRVKVDVDRMSLTLQHVQLLKSQIVLPPVSDGAPYLDYLNQDILIPDEETTYWCTRFELPSFIMERPHHIIRFDGVISPQSQGIVHHMELFHCDVDPEIQIPAYNGRCTSEQKPMGLISCRRVIGAWAYGAANFFYPEEAGGILGGPKTSHFLVLEVHFNNPYLKKGIIDQSGIRLYYTPTLRKYDAGIMEVGLEYNPKNSIPPDSSAFRISGYCKSECTQVGLQSNGIFVFASQLHTHLTGIETFTRIIKPNGRIVTLNLDRHYSPHFQEIRLLPKPIKIERGDTILHTCIYNTKMRTNMTFGGYGINDEMCVNYMHYYPRSSLELCKTSISDGALDEFFKATKKYFHAKTSIDKTIYENYASIHWTSTTSSLLQDYYEEASIHLSCNGSDGNYLLNYDWQNDYFPLEPEQRDVPLDTALCK
ncbi:unnamed protein product [Rotaria socialis]|uniref:Uncharacterized protein n=1 Tax=Rotaria socialis TaxID=392032 RepID=A0A818MCB0_9BILA|nr:unnamed protein product [Rotaria socialis]CAF4725854.1 unnamed protein product [Rotaria socialis]